MSIIIEKKTVLLLGATESDSLVFANIEIRCNSFSASFDEVAPFIANYETMELHAQSRIDCYDDRQILDLLKLHDCKPSELVDVMIDNSEVCDLVDTSLLEDSYSVDGVDDLIYFESVGCGQHDTRGEFGEKSKIINKPIFDKIHELWDKYHLQAIPQEEYQELHDMVEAFEKDFDQDEWIRNWLNEKYKG